jgi:hypothetical protein
MTKQTLVEKYEHGGSVMTFMDYIELSEGISPREVNYGTDWKNRQFEVDSDGTFITKVNSSSGKYVILIERRLRPGWFDVSFGSLKPDHLDADDISPTNYTMSDQVSTRNATMVFGEISWVILRFAAEHRAQKLMFTAGYSKLNAFYKVLLRNTTFIKKLESYGYAVDEEINLAYSGVFALTKIQP